MRDKREDPEFAIIGVIGPFLIKLIVRSRSWKRESREWSPPISSVPKLIGSEWKTDRSTGALGGAGVSPT